MTPILIENRHFRYVLDSQGRTLGFVDKATGRDHRDAGITTCFAEATCGERRFTVTSLAQEGTRLRARFGELNAEAVFSVASTDAFIRLDLVELTGGDAIDILAFAHVELDLDGRLDEPFGACALALNLQTNVEELPGPCRRLRALCYRRFGPVGASAALIACPPSGMRVLLKATVSAADGLPHSAVGGPWALDAPMNRGSYLINAPGMESIPGGPITESTVDAWIATAQALGFEQIDFHTGHTLRFGDYEPDRAIYPDGLESVKRVIDKLHAAGILAGLHTYAFFMAKTTPWVTPVPDPRLAKSRAFTLGEDIDGEASSIAVIEPTAGMSAVTGFHVRNSATLQIDDELIEFGDVVHDTKVFSRCVRGACGTRVSAHRKGTPVYHLKELFGLFAPEGDSDLFAEIAARTAAVYNACGFDMIYLDALDGEDVFAGAEHGWHYGAKFVYELVRRVNKPPLLEMSAFHHHLWCVRSRMGAWDVPSRGAKRFVDMHVVGNADCARMFLPPHLGWWGAFDWDGVQPERTWPEVFEYVCGKCVAHDCGLSLLVGFTPELLESSSNTRRLADLVRRYERLRATGGVSDAAKRQLRRPGVEFTLDSAGKEPRLHPIEAATHRVDSRDAATCAWTVHNPYAAQTPCVRIEPLLSPEPFDSPDGLTLTSFQNLTRFDERLCEDGVEVALSPSTLCAPNGMPCARFTGHSMREDRNGAWGRVGMRFEPNVDLRERRALGLWVYGDGKGQLLNIQQRAAIHAAGGYSEHYVPIDFEGWRYVELVEPESDRIVEWRWPYMRPSAEWERDPSAMMMYAYPMLHFWVDYGKIAQISLYLNNLPSGEPVECHLGPIRALPLRKTTLAAPCLTINGEAITFPADLESGWYLEYDPAGPCTVFDEHGNPRKRVVPRGTMPTLRPGENAIRFECGAHDAQSPVATRARVTIRTRGEALEG